MCRRNRPRSDRIKSTKKGSYHDPIEHIDTLRRSFEWRFPWSTSGGDFIECIAIAVDRRASHVILLAGATVTNVHIDQ